MNVRNFSRGYGTMTIRGRVPGDFFFVAEPVRTACFSCGSTFDLTLPLSDEITIVDGMRRGFSLTGFTDADVVGRF